MGNSTCPLAQASVKRVGRAEITDHSPVWRVGFFIAKKLFKLRNKPCFLNSILLKRSLNLNINLPFPFYKVLYSELSNNLVLKCNVGLRKCSQLWIPPCNYITYVLVQSDTAGHYRTIGDQANVALKDRSWEGQARLLVSCKDLTKIYQ